MHTLHTLTYILLCMMISMYVYIYIHADAGQHTEGNTQISQQ